MMGRSVLWNLGNSVAVVLCEAFDRMNFAGMNLEGHLHELNWE